MAFPIRVLIVSLAVTAVTVDYITRNNLNLAIVSMVSRTNSHLHGNISVFANAANYMTRTNLNIAIISMVTTSNLANSTSEFNYDACPISGNVQINESSFLDSSKASSMSAPRYDWSPKTQGIILGAFFYAYVLMQVPAGRLSELFGSRWIMAIGLAGSGLINLLTPALASSLTLLTMSRVALGIVQGGIYAAGYGLLHKWFPKKERSLAIGLLELGCNLGSIVASLLTGFLSEHGFAGGWPSAFYVAGLIAFVAFLLFVPFVTSSPEEHRFISKAEIAYINQDREISDEKCSKPKVPWKAMLTSKRVISYSFGRFCLFFTFAMIQTKLPTYMNDVLHISPTENGIVNAMLYLAVCTTLSVCGPASEYIIRRQWLNRTNTRKLFVGISYIGTGLCVLMVPVVGCDSKAVTAFLILSQFFRGACSGGDLPIPGEMTTHFPATLFSITNVLIMSSNFIAPLIAGVILESGRDMLHCWNIVFTLSGCITIFGAIVIIFFAEAEIQPWDKPVKNDSDDTKSYSEKM